MFLKPFIMLRKQSITLPSYVKMTQLNHLIGCVPAFVLKHSLTHPFIFSPDPSPINQLAEAQHREQEFYIQPRFQLTTLDSLKWHDVKTDPGSLMKGLNVNRRLKLAPSYTVCLLYSPRYKKPRTHLSCPSQCFSPCSPTLPLMRSLSLASASFLFGGAGASVVKILEEPVFEGVMEKWAVKRKKKKKNTN